MSHSSFTASERRGIIVIAVISLLIIGGGVVIALCGRNPQTEKEIPVVVVHPEMADSVPEGSNKEKSVKKNSKKKSSSSKNKTKKSYPRRSPLDEPV